jgi:hypothetical protein
MGYARRMAGQAQKPPIVLHGCCVEQYAIRDRSMSFRGQGRLFVDGKEVGPVPRLAVGRSLGTSITGLMVFHCDGRWNVVAGDGPYPTLREAMQEAERFYPGISPAWKRTGYTRAQAERQLVRMGPTCSMCSTIWLNVEKIVEVKKGVQLCDVCIRKLHKAISAK